MSPSTDDQPVCWSPPPSPVSFFGWISANYNYPAHTDFCKQCSRTWSVIWHDRESLISSVGCRAAFQPSCGGAVRAGGWQFYVWL